MTLLNRKAERGDAGTYKLILKNSEGASQVQFRVTVLSPPTKPEGPLEATNITAEGCTLDWKPPVSRSSMTNGWRIFRSTCFRKTKVAMISNIMLLNDVNLEQINGPKLDRL